MNSPSISNPYTADEQQLMLDIAREALTAAANQNSRPKLDVGALPPALQERRACFVTLNEDGELRGCTGTIVPRRTLAEEISVSAVHSALFDPRFLPVRNDEVPHIQIEVSVLTLPTRVQFSSPEDLIRQLRPGIDGVVLERGGNRATYLPQVWDRFPNAVEFLNSLSLKAGLAADAWRKPGMQVEVYQTVVFEEHAE